MRVRPVPQTPGPQLGLGGRLRLPTTSQVRGSGVALWEALVTGLLWLQRVEGVSGVGVLTQNLSGNSLISSLLDFESLLLFRGFNVYKL